MAVTDDERRRVAAALREYASFDHECEDEEECLVDCADWGERVLNLLDCGDTEGECYAALADLIEPSDHIGDSDKMVDRDALLALASGLEADADRILRAARNARFGGGPRMGEAKHDAYEWRSIARRIREACGEVVG